MLRNSYKYIYKFIFAAVCFFQFVSVAEAAKISFVVPKHNIAYGELIGENDLTYKYFVINASAALRYVLDTKQALGKMAKIMLLKDRPVLLNDLKAPIIVEEGKQVKLVVKNGALTISATGIPLQSGSVGDYIKVKNMDSGIIVSGTILSDGTVGVSVE